MTGSLRQPEPVARGGVGWYVFEHLADADIADKRAIERMTHEQQQVFALNMLRSEVASGGFERYFTYTGGNTALLASEASLILTPAWSALIDDACQPLGHPYPSAHEARYPVVDRLIDEHPDVFSHLDRHLNHLEADESADERIDSFVWSNKAAFFI